MDVHEFIAKWRSRELNERQSYVSHFNDLCEVLGQPKPTDADPTGSWYSFEYGVAKESGRDGWADVYKKGCFGWEYKGPGRDLDSAYEQLKDYRTSLENPPLLVVCDIRTFRIYTHFQNSPVERYEFTLEELPALSPLKPEHTNLELLGYAFASPEKLRLGVDPAYATEQAAKNIGDIALKLRQRGIPPLEAAHYVMKLVFCLFAQSIELLPKPFLTLALNRCRERLEEGVETGLLGQLFREMDAGGAIFADDIPAFNGGLFDGQPPLPLQREERRTLLQACHQDWSRIEPSIFGTLLERAIDPARQQQLGAHYTDPKDVMKVVKPVVLDPLLEEWVALRAELDVLPGPGSSNGGVPAAVAPMTSGADNPVAVSKRKTTKSPRQNGTQTHIGKSDAKQQRIEGFLTRLATLRILDPACGSGNFLYLALRAVMDLEEEVLRYAHRHNIPVLAKVTVGPAILHGREIDPYAKELASTVIWIGYIQHRKQHRGKYTDRPVLRPLDNIVLADSILNEDGTRPDWPECDYIVGNPPFLGFYRQREALGDQYNTRLRRAYAGFVEGQSDLCCFFFEQARRHIQDGKAKRAGLLGTNSIRQGDSRRVLDRINSDTPIFNAWDDEEWVLDGAAVRISIVCFGAEDEIPAVHQIDGESVPIINADLSTGIDLTVAEPLAENQGLSFLGNLKGGNFDLDEKAALKMLAAKGNPNKRPNSDVIRLKINGKEFLYPHWRKQYRIDFGVDMPIEEAAKYVEPFEYLRKNVQPVRETNREKGQRDRWWLHMRPRPEMRAAIAGLQRYLATPEITDHRVFRFFPVEVIPDHRLIVFPFQDWFRFGVLQCRIHLEWTIANCSTLEDRLCYTPTTVFETFPFPRISPHLRERYPLQPRKLAAAASRRGSKETGDGGLQPPPIINEAEAAALIAAVEQAAQELYEARDNVVLTPGTNCPSYTQLYKENPAWLQLAHAKLDRAVLACYGLPPDAGKHDILAHLLTENLAREPRKSNTKKK